MVDDSARKSAPRLEDGAQTTDVLLAAALPFELRPFGRHLGIDDIGTEPVHTTHDGRRVALLATGMGRPGDRIFAAALRNLRPASVINVGIAGALDLAHPAGSTWVVDEWREQVQPHAVAANPDAGLSATLRRRLQAGGVTHGGAIVVTVDAPLHDEAERDRLCRDAGAHLVEMEGAPWARIAADHGVPFGAVRVVSDHANRPLPGPRPRGGRRAWLLRDDGTPRKGRLAIALLASTAWLRPRHHLSEIRAAGDQFRLAVEALDAVAAALFAGERPRT